MDQTIRLRQGYWQETWWVWATHGGALACLFATGLEAWLTGALATLVGADAWRTARRYGLRDHPLSVIGVHVQYTRIAGLNLSNGRYLRAAALGRCMRLGLVDVITVQVYDQANAMCVIVDAHRSLITWERHLLRLATRHLSSA